METVFSFLISVGIIAFGVWIVVGSVAAGLPLAWTFIGLFPLIVGSMSLYDVIRTPRARSHTARSVPLTGHAVTPFSGTG
jgi:hypothetical protein